ESGLQPSIVSLTAAVTACAAGDKWQAAILLAASPASPTNAKPAAAACNAAISACGSCAKWRYERASDGLASMYLMGSKDLVNFVRLVAQQRVLCVCDFSKPGSAMEDSFQRHLEALNAVYEQVILENAQLRKQLGQAPEFGDLRQLTQSGSMPPLPPMATVSTLNLQESTVQLPGALCDSEKLSPQILEGDPIEPPGDGAKGDTNEDSASCNGDNAPSLPETPRPPASSPPKMTDHMKSLKSRASRRSSFLRNSLRTNDSDEETEDDATFLLMLDVVPSIVILISAVVAGFSQDISPDHGVWVALEMAFTLFFVGEIVVKIRVFGLIEYIWGADWYWSWFDVICVVLAIVDLSLNLSAAAKGEENDTGALSSLKMLKLARLGRIVRLLKFKIFQELKLMIQGVFTGLRVLFWAVVLLVGCMYLLGVVTRTIFSDYAEFSTVPIAMLTNFRCFTDGCVAFDGTPLQWKLEQEFGGPFMIAYILLFLFVTIGIFNLIMAVFIDNVTDGSTKKRQRELGQNAPKTAFIISDALRHLILTSILRKEAESEAAEMERKGRPRRVSKILREKMLGLKEMYGYKPHSASEYDELTSKIRADMMERNIVVTKDEFNHWLHTEKALLETLDDCEIDLSCKFDLFDVLDADLSGELEFEEMIDGLLKCRGPASKTDIIAIRLKTRLLVRMMNRVCEKLGIEAED
ncbi:CACNA1F, partial [Symbiodinium necroappetens]